MIYLHVLPINQKIPIPAAGISAEEAEVHPRSHEPALLQVNRKLRKETSTLYYRCNTFNIEIHNFNPANVVTWLQLCRSRKDPKFTASMSLKVHEPEGVDVVDCWGSLMFWLYHYYSYEAVGLSVDQRLFGDEGPPMIMAARRMFREVDRLRKVEGSGRLHWGEIVEILAGMRAESLAFFWEE